MSGFRGRDLFRAIRSGLRPYARSGGDAAYQTDRCALTQTALATAAASLVLAGCRSLPTYPWVDTDTAMAHMTRRAERVHTIAGRCDLAFTNERGETIRLDAAIAARPPDHLRLRAWKLGQAVFDLLLTPDGFWVQTRDEDLSSALEVDRFLGAWTVAVTGRPTRAVTYEDDGGREFTVVGREERADARWTVRCVIERSTLLPRRYTLEDETGAELYVLQLGRYRSFDGIAWPTRMTGRAAGRGFVLEITDPIFNEETASDAFKPPHGAVRRSAWQPIPETSRSPRSSLNGAPS